jgi:hypothetical protein
MLEVEGDFWDVFHEYDAVACMTNKTVKDDGELIMGGGIAAGFKHQWNWLPYVWGQELKKDHRRDVMVTMRPHAPHLIAFPTKYHPKSRSLIPLIEKCASELAVIAKTFDWKILITRPGCGLGGLKWDRVRLKLRDYFDDRITVIERTE